MKTIKFIGICAALVGVSLATASCDDMLEPDSDLVMYEDGNRLDSENDTLYSVMGVVSLMQNVADRTNILGELRGDLVSVTPDGTTALREIATFAAGEDNPYNAPESYYAIVNACNYFLATADTAMARHGRKVFEREYAVIKTFRAWAYLQLALNYGTVPFYTHFVGTKEAGDAVMQGERRDIIGICNYFIEDLQDCVNILPLDYGSINGYASAKFFIPVRVLLGDLCLWAGRYAEAAQYYHDFIADNDEPRRLTRNVVAWNTITLPVEHIVNGYSGAFASLTAADLLTFIPMESTAFNGTISHLDDIYNSTEDNDYYFQVTRSEALLTLSQAQDYDFVYIENNKRDTICLRDSVFASEYSIGDLRLYATLDESIVYNSGSSTYAENRLTNRKHQTDHVALYRLPAVYLRYAEAMNRAGFPSAAFMVLKYGICSDYIQRYVDSHERENAGTLLSFNQYSFTRDNALGLHARGCGDVDANPHYVLPIPADSLASYADTVAWQIPRVEDLIMDEMALECAFEGTRYYDLMRIAMRRGDDAYLAARVAAREGADAFDTELYGRLLNRANWYLPLSE